jgi:hypothetical protein
MVGLPSQDIISKNWPTVIVRGESPPSPELAAPLALSARWVAMPFQFTPSKKAWTVSFSQG